MTATIQRRPLVLAIMAMIAAFVSFPFQMYGWAYIALFWTIALIWFYLVVISFHNRAWKGILALVMPASLAIPYILAGLWFSCATGSFGGCI